MTTKCFTYEVTMIVQILAEDETSANQALDEKGGYVSSRKTKLVKATNIDEKVKLVK